MASASRSTKVTVRTLDGGITVGARYVEGGLAITPAIGATRSIRYAITHVASGRKVPGSGVRTLQEARALLGRILPLADWTQSMSALTRADRRKARALQDALRLAVASKAAA